MQAAADIEARLLRAALRRRAPLWLAAALPWVLLLSPFGVVLALAWIVWDAARLRTRVRRGWTGWLDASLPWLEDSSALLRHAEGAVARLQRARIARRLEADLDQDMLAAIVGERVRFDWRVAAASMVPALALLLWAQLSGAPVSARAVLASLAPQSSDVLVRVIPPRYLGGAASESGPRDLAPAQFSVIEWCRRPGQDTGGMVELSDGRRLAFGARCARIRLLGALTWRWRGRSYRLALRPDRPPELSVSVPRELAEDAQVVPVTVRVRDDHRIRRATLHLLLARPVDGELQFSEREVVLPESRDPRQRLWSRQWTVVELGMQPGDELYLQARALDNAEIANNASSVAVSLRLPAPGDEASVVLQRRVVAGIEQLRADLAADALDEPARLARVESLAALQDLLRERYAVYLDEHGEQAPVDAAVRPAMRRAAWLMNGAAEQLRGGELAPALAAAQRVLALVTDLQQAERLHLYPRASAALDDAVFDPPAAAAFQGMPSPPAAVQPALRTPARIDTPFARAWPEAAP